MTQGVALAKFWKNKNVLVTGHTGFKGSWLCFCLNRFGANVTGVSLEPDSSPNLFHLLNGENICNSIICDIRNFESLSEHCKANDPEFIFHLAAQPIVRESYLNPVDTFESNIMGTVNILESMKLLSNLKAAVMITTDKVYQENNVSQAYVEGDHLGGHDPYSSSKAACEIVIDSYRKSFLSDRGISIASARAGNVIGGGDWSKDRLIPDAIRAWESQNILKIRRPYSTRPWQHVLEPIYGYMMLAQQITSNPKKAEAYNFGPDSESIASVRDVITLANNFFSSGKVIYDQENEGPHEADWLSLDITKAKDNLGFTPKWSLSEAVEHTISWYMDLNNGQDAVGLCNKQIDLYENAK
jgi:CDP-glucose 4,6-dehydratase